VEFEVHGAGHRHRIERIEAHKAEVPPSEVPPSAASA